MDFLKLNLKTKFSIFFYLVFAGFVLYISGFIGLLEFSFSLVFYGVVFYIFYFIYFAFKSVLLDIFYKIPYFKKKKKVLEKMSFKNYLIYFYNRLAIFGSVIILLFGSLFYYQNNIAPAKLPEYTLSNGKKTIVFQGMAHIGSNDFYNTVRDNLAEYKKNGFVLFFEGVKPGTPENNQKFNTLLGFNFDSKTYDSLSKLYGLRPQKNQEFLGLVNNNDFNIDTNIDTIVSQYEKKYGDVKNKKKLIVGSEKLVNVGEYVDKVLLALSEKELKILIYINRAIMNFIIKNDSVQDFAINKTGNNDVFDIILNNRNNIIINEVKTTKYDKVYIMYGLMHFRGVFDALKQADNNRKIVSTKYFYPIK